MNKTNSDLNYDLSYIREIGEDDAFIKMLIKTFLDSSKEDLELFDSYYNDEDWALVGHIAHKMQSRTQHFKMHALRSLLKKIEMQCMQLQFNQNFSVLVQQMKALYWLIIEELNVEYLNLNKPRD